MKLIRFVIGKILLFFNFLTFPKKGVRTQEEVLKIKEDLKGYSLYQFEACPFCIKIRRTLQRLNLPIELKDAKKEPCRSELLKGGGKVKVPCLKYIENNDEAWMYESLDIIKFLEKKFPLKN